MLGSSEASLCLPGVECLVEFCAFALDPQPLVALVNAKSAEEGEQEVPADPHGHTQQRGDLWREARQPQLVPRLISEWDPDTRRPPYPTSHEIPVYLFDDPLP